VANLAVQILKGLQSLHKADIIYKDLKASHMFFDSNMEVTLIDFGLSEDLGEGESTTSVPGGTFHSMAPEMLNLYFKTLTN